MSWVEIFVGSLISTSTVVAVASFVARESFLRLLDTRLERFKHDLQIEATRRELMLKSQIEFKERQISEFYGPIYAMLKRGRTLVRLLLDGKLSEVEDDFWKLARETNASIENIILGKSHLIEGAEIPPSFVRFVTHVPLWDWFMLTRHKLPPSRDELPEAWYSEEFETAIYETTERLKQELDELYRRFGVMASSVTADLAEGGQRPVAAS